MDRPGRNTARELRVQLNSALSDADPCPVRFELGPVETEATVAVDRSRGASGKGEVLGRRGERRHVHHLNAD
jgi:hypothetical protein